MGGPGGQGCEETVCIQHGCKVPITSKGYRGHGDGMVIVPNSDDFISCESCGQRLLRMAAGNEKRTRWWNQDVEEAIRAKKDAFKTLLQNRSSSNLQSGSTWREK